MSLEQSLYETLKDDADVSGVVGTRIYPVMAPEGSMLPRITYQRISHDREYAASGYGGLQTARIQIDCWAEPTAKGYGDADTLLTHVIDALEGLNGDIGTTNVTNVRSSFLENDSDDSEPPQDASQFGPHRRRADFIFKYV